MQLRRLQKELIDYAPPVLNIHHTLSGAEAQEKPGHAPWWVYSYQEEKLLDEKALIRVKGQVEELEELNTPKGLLLTGPPGSGKSFLIDTWFAALPTPYKARKHYSQLVLEIYRAVWEETQRRMATVTRGPTDVDTSRVPWNRAIRDQWRALVKNGTLPPTWSRRLPHTSSTFNSDPTIAFVVAKRLLLTHWLLVLDEIQLLDVSSANLLADVLSWYWRMGGVVVGTSNKVPEDLYQNGVSRERLEGFVTALKARCPVVEMAGAKDWRVMRGGEKEGRTWFTTDQEAQFEEMTIGQADYLSLASTYHTVIITHVPMLQTSDKNQARRFISLIDALYEARCRILCLAECEPERLFFPDALELSSARAEEDDVDVMMAEAVGETQAMYRPNVSLYDAPRMSEALPVRVSPEPLDTLSIFSGRDEQFAFKRALSRLIEMTSSNYRSTEQWTPLPATLRKWEEAPGPVPPLGHLVPPHTAMSARNMLGSHLNDDSDFASEASYGQPQRDADRPDAPRLGQEHVWGVRDDWGPRSKAWGRGAKAFSHSDSASNSSEPR
ncbi:hypothetical protein HWV62_8303 [Athelia sp. TMB]|nr:hypothetical protein HWV62_8303 [Athelia sp. TMB]